MTHYEQRQLEKSKIIPQVAEGLLTLGQAALKLNMTRAGVLYLTRRYKERGTSAFTSARKGCSAHNKKYILSYKEYLIKIYHDNWEGCPYKTFQRGLALVEGIDINYTSLRSILKEYNIKSMRSRKPREKEVHESRRERPCTGEMLQLDGSKHDWLMNGQYQTIHGAIDDATHKITGLYMCENECRLGYNEVLRQTFKNYGSPESVYIDRHSSFVITPREKLLTIEETLQRSKNAETHFTSVCKELNIEIILALSAQGKGRIERLWQTLQGIIPFFLRRLNITTIPDANRFLQEKFIPEYNRTFSVTPRLSYSRFKPVKKNLDDLLSLKFTKRTDNDGYFVFHEQYFYLKMKSPARRKITVYLSEQFGIKAKCDGLFYDVEMCDSFGVVRSNNSMPLVEQDLISRYLTNDLHDDSLCVI